MFAWIKKTGPTAAGYTLFIYIILILKGCALQNTPQTIAEPKPYKTEVPFQFDNKGILISTFWGTGKKEYKLYLDNHSPTWANDYVLHSSASVLKSKNFLYHTTTADGKVIEGDVYICNSMAIGAVNFKNIALYNISNKTNEGRVDGAIGENIMAEGIWKIDFNQQLLTVSSAIDSIKGMEQAELLPAAFTEKGIEIEVSFRNNSKEKFELDLGYNGSLIMPAREFASVTAGNKKTFTEARRFSTPAGASTVENTIVRDSIRVGRQHFATLISTNKLVKEKLIGLDFFNQFEFVVIDYINKAVYLSKKRLYQ